MAREHAIQDATCAACGAPLAPAMRFCGRCGLAVSASLLLPTPPSRPAATSTSRRSQTASPNTAVQQTERHLADLLNADRARYHARPLTLEAELSAVARAHSRALALHKGQPWAGWPHAGRDGSSPFRRMEAGGYRMPPYTTQGENIGWTQGYPSLQAAVAAIHGGMMAEPAGQPNHRGAILNPLFRILGVGIVALGDRVWVTEEFAG